MFFPLSCLFDLIEIIKSQTLHKNLARNTGVALYENVEAAKELFKTYEMLKKVFVEEAGKGKKLWQITMEWQCMTA